MTQEELADRVGVRPQQIQKYETGMNRVSSSRLWELAKTLEVPVSYFFERPGDRAAILGGAEGDVPVCKEAVELVRAYYTIPEAQRRRLFDLARVLGTGGLDPRQGAA